jgi:hypothetical protein
MDLLNPLKKEDDGKKRRMMGYITPSTLYPLTYDISSYF